MSELENVGFNIRTARTEKNLTLHQLRDQLMESGSTIHEGYLSRIERGLRIPSLGTAIKIARALGKSLDDLVAEPTTEDERDTNYRSIDN